MPKRSTPGSWRISEYCEYRSISRPTFYRWLGWGLKSVKIGGTRLILREHDQEFMERHRDSG